jgi:glycosyltransferase involved in cell wall biosynthesis
MSNWVEKEIYKRGLSDTVHLLGRYPVEAMPRFFALSDALLVTLKKEPIFALTIPSKIQSYLACGKPIVAALNGEGSRIIEEARAGITCPAGDPNALAEAVIKLYSMSKTERDTIGFNGRSYFEKNFERKGLIDRLERLMAYLKGGVT